MTRAPRSLTMADLAVILPEAVDSGDGEFVRLVAEQMVPLPSSTVAEAVAKNEAVIALGWQAPRLIPDPHLADDVAEYCRIVRLVCEECVRIDRSLGSLLTLSAAIDMERLSAAFVEAPYARKH